MFDVTTNSLGLRNCVNEKTNEHGANEPADYNEKVFHAKPRSRKGED